MSGEKGCKPNCAVAALPPDLKHIKPEERKSYRQRIIQQWLDQMLVRAPKECFGHYIGRIYTVASRELDFNSAARSCIGDEFPHFLDKFVWRILQGSRLIMIKHGVSLAPQTELENLAILREECDELFNDMQIIPDPRTKMKPGDSWEHEKGHCSTSRAGRACEKEKEHKDGYHEAKCDSAAGKNFTAMF